MLFESLKRKAENVKMKKHPVFLSLLLAAVILISGFSVAYYNTKKYGFEENPKIFSYDDKGFSVFDLNFYYEDLRHLYYDIYRVLPGNHIS